MWIWGWVEGSIEPMTEKTDCPTCFRACHSVFPWFFSIATRPLAAPGHVPCGGKAKLQTGIWTFATWRINSCPPEESRPHSQIHSSNYWAQPGCMPLWLHLRERSFFLSLGYLRIWETLKGIVQIPGLPCTSLALSFLLGVINLQDRVDSSGASWPFPASSLAEETLKHDQVCTDCKFGANSENSGNSFSHSLSEIHFPCWMSPKEGFVFIFFSLSF